MPEAIDQSTAIITALNTILAPGQIVEIRILKAVTATYKAPHTMSGYFDDWTKIPDAIKAAGIKYAPAFYFTLNPPRPELLSRAMNRIKDASETTSDNDITIRRWLLIDPDPIRPAGISSTDTEHEAALTRAREIRVALRDKGWPDPILADSGNGAHLLYRIDLPRDDHDLVKHVLEALAFWHDDEVISIDQAVYNPARIDKLYGTRVRKGDNTPERPHRISAILETPAEIKIVPIELLEALANSKPQEDPAPKKGYSGNNGKPFDLQNWIVTHGLDVKGPLKWNDGQKWIFNECPWNSEHKKSAFIIQRGDGAIGAGCRHNSCRNKKWEDVREIYEPGYRERKVSPSPNVIPNDNHTPNHTSASWYNLESLPPGTTQVFIPADKAGVLICDQAGLPAICSINNSQNPHDLKARGITRIDIIANSSQAGISTAQKLCRTLRLGGVDVQIRGLPDNLGPNADLTTLHKWHRGNNESFKKAFETLEFLEFKEDSSPVNSRTAEILTATSLIARDFPPIKWAVPGLIPEGINMLAGRPKLGKSWMALGIAIAIGSGGYVLGQIKVDQGSVLYLGLEDSLRRLKDRLLKMLDGVPPPPQLYLTTECPRVGEGGIEYIESWLQDHNDARMVVVDTYIKVRQPRKANADIYDADYQAITAYREIAEKHRVAILLIHHLRKASADDPFDAILGTTGVGGSIDAGLVLQRERGKADAVLSVAGRDTEEKKVALRWDADLAQWVMLGDAEEFRMNVLKQAILNTLRRTGDSLSPKEVADSIGDTIPGANYNSIRQHMHQMGKDGTLKVTERGRYTLLLSKVLDEANALDEALESLKGIGGDTWKEPF